MTIGLALWRDCPLMAVDGHSSVRMSAASTGRASARGPSLAHSRLAAPSRAMKTPTSPTPRTSPRRCSTASAKGVVIRHNGYAKPRPPRRDKCGVPELRAALDAKPVLSVVTTRAIIAASGARLRHAPRWKHTLRSHVGATEPRLCWPLQSRSWCICCCSASHPWSACSWVRCI